mgnify:CR=1 FL=1
MQYLILLQPFLVKIHLEKFQIHAQDQTMELYVDKLQHANESAYCFSFLAINEKLNCSEEYCVKSSVLDLVLPVRERSAL